MAIKKFIIKVYQVIADLILFSLFDYKRSNLWTEPEGEDVSLNEGSD